MLVAGHMGQCQWWDGGYGDTLTEEGAAQRELEGGTWVLMPVLVAESVMMGQGGGTARQGWGVSGGMGCVVAPQDVQACSVRRHGVEVA